MMANSVVQVLYHYVFMGNRCDTVYVMVGLFKGIWKKVSCVMLNKIILTILFVCLHLRFRQIKYNQVVHPHPPMKSLSQRIVHVS